MTHIYLIKDPAIERRAVRKNVVANINILRKFERFNLIEERISKNMFDLHSLWFRKDKRFLGQ